MIADNETAIRQPELSAAKRALLERRLRGDPKSKLRTSGLPRRSTSGPAPLSFAQQRLWFFHQLASESPLYNISLAFRVEGRLDREALSKSLAAIVARHESLRTRFLCVDGEPVQVIDEPPPSPLRVVDLSDGRIVREAEIQRLFKEEASRPFNLSGDLLLRPVLARFSDTDHALLLTLHHIASDGWSMGVLFRELTALYEAIAVGRPPVLPELPIQYADYAAWQRNWMQGELLQEHLAYWKRELAGAPDFLDLPADHPRPAVQTFRGRWHWKTFPKPLCDAIKALSQQEGATLFMMLMAAFQTLLHRYTGQPDILIGSPIAGRNQMETEGMIGFFINTLVLRGDLSGDPTFCELLKRVRETTLGAYAHQDLPFERLVEELHPARTSGHASLVQVLFVLQNAPGQTLALPGLAITPIPMDEADTGTAKFDLTLQVEEDSQGMRVAVEYNTDLFDDATIVRLVGHFQTLLEGIVAGPNRRLSELPLLTPAERNQLIDGWNDTRTHYPRSKTIPELFAEQAADRPDTIALSFEQWRLTYGELEVYANQLAHFLQRHGVGPDTLVGVCLERSVEMIVAVLGILKAGGAYVALDPAHPKERLALILEESQASVLLTQEKLRNALPDFAGHCPSNSPSRGPLVVCLDAGWSEMAQESSTAPSSRTTPENLAYVSYTSGSTGVPKGVCVPHRGVVRLVKETNYARFGPDEIFLQLAPLAFDASTLEIWGPLLNGGRLVIFPQHAPSLAELGEFIERNQITTLWLTSGLFHQMVEEQLDRLKGVRQLLAGGDVLSVPHVAKALEKLTRTQLINGYGPTENATFTCCHRISAPLASDRSIPIGRPIANTEVYVLDEHLQPAPIGVPGELYIAGDGLARGYLNRPELTAERFIDCPFGTGGARRGPQPQPSRRGFALEPDPDAMFPDAEERSRSPGVESAGVPARLYKTGDRVRWLPDGTIEFLGRTDRQVKIRGFRIELEEIETVLARHPSVKETVVVAPEDDPGEKRLVAYVVADQLPPTPAELRQFLQRNLPDYMVPSAFVSLTALPLNANGKVDRSALPSPDALRAASNSEFAAPPDEMEKRLAQIWENVLNVQPVGIRDNFFELGGHSLLAVRLVARIEREFGKKLPLAVLFQAPTVEHLADVLRDRQPAVACSSLVAIQPQGSKPPVFFVHGVGAGNLWTYANLAPHLGDDQPVYGLESRGMRGLEEFSSIEEMAAHYLEEIRTVQPRSPYYLGGYCFGGNVAYEIARQLHTQGETVAFLALLDSAPMNTGYNQIPWWRPGFLFNFLLNTGYWLNDFRDLTSAERSDLIFRKVRAVGKRLARRFRRTGSGPAPIDLEEVIDVTRLSALELKLWEIHLRAMRDYVPQPYPGRVTLFRTRGQPFLCSFDPLFGWGGLAAGGVEVVVIPGSHEKIFVEPHVRTLAAKLKAYLSERQSLMNSEP